MKSRLVFLLLLGVFLSSGWAALAQPPVREQLVYSLTSFNGSTYSKSFAPQSEDTIYLIANTNSIVNPRKTIVYYWPITRRYMAGFSTLNEAVPGKLEILQGGKVIATLEEQKYVLYYPEGYFSEKTIMYLNAEADAAYEKYKKAMDEFNAKLKEYYEAMRKYREDLNKFFEEVRRRREAGETGPLDIPVPKEPSPPEFVNFYVSEPATGFVVNLPPGHYEIRVRLEDGTVLEGSEKKLVVFTSRRKGGIGYEIIPGNRWTKRENCDDPSWIIHAVGKNELYFNPFTQEEYNELYHNKLQDPQNIGRIERWKWVHADPVKDATLLFGRGKEVLKAVTRAPYFVKQIPGPELGYEIVDYDEDLKKRGYKPTFESYKVVLGPELPKVDYTIQTVASENQMPLPKSERTIRLLRKAYSVYLYPLAFLPLAVGAGIVITRRARIET
ncbi:hypothetical protein ACP6EK_04320 [Candidatus Caldatribacterium sp. SIUC1]|uniref:hypothetical protein n=1 Tax=Candidatus Caldatribacterium sp. SIUC1 TaxID=3418365 RepID=UPI003F692D67